MIQSILGIFVLLGVGLLFSDNRRLISWRAVIGAFGIIIALAFLYWQPRLVPMCCWPYRIP